LCCRASSDEAFIKPACGVKAYGESIQIDGRSTAGSRTGRALLLLVFIDDATGS